MNRPLADLLRSALRGESDHGMGIKSGPSTFIRSETDFNIVNSIGRHRTVFNTSLKPD